MDSNKIFSKNELESYIHTLSTISYIFQNSDRLIDDRNNKMKSCVFSYASILGFYYEKIFEYGKMSDIVDANIASHYKLIELSMLDNKQRKQIIADLADNWSDVLQVIFNLELDDNEAGNNFKKIDSDIQKITIAFENLSGKTCRKPINPFNTVPQIVSYNPFHITEDINLSKGHYIPDITDVFAQELIPMLLSAKYLGEEIKDIVANYAISMVKSYYDNAGIVPMVIIDQITGQINQVAEMVQHVSYAPQNNLKEYVLSKIYR